MKHFEPQNLHIHYNLPPVAKSCGWQIIKRLSYVCPSVRPSLHSSHFYINLNSSFIYKNIFTKFAGNVYGYENMSVQNFGLILKKKMAAIADCLEIIKML